MPRKKSTRGGSIRRVLPSVTISRGHIPVDPRPRGWNLNLVPRGAPQTPEERQALADRGVVMAALYAQCGSYAEVARLFDVDAAVVRHAVREARASSTDVRTAALRLKGNVAQLAVDRVEEGLMEGDLEFAADLGTKVLKGLGELKTHSAIKSDGPAHVASLTLNIVRTDPNLPVPEQIAGAVVGQPYDEKAAAADVIDAEVPEDDGESPHAAG